MKVHKNDQFKHFMCTFMGENEVRGNFKYFKIKIVVMCTFDQENFRFLL